MRKSINKGLKMKLTEHFTLDELTASGTALRRGIDNTPFLDVVTHLTITAKEMERIRVLLDDKIIIVKSGYRSPMLNRAIGGASTSAHLTGYAVDFICPDYGSPIDIARAIEKSDIIFDQLIQEGGWVHISFAPAMRNQVLTANFAGGEVTYTRGV